MNFKKLILFHFILIFAGACKEDVSDRQPSSLKEQFPKEHLNPLARYGPLLVEVQMQHVFPDGKTFVDCIPKIAADSILKLYAEQREKPGFDLKAFVLQHFNTPEKNTERFQADTTRTVTEHINALWPFLKREADEKAPGSRIALPNPYIIPGGRFREVYYWDSYFILLGLKASGEIQLMENIIDNFAYQINTFGYIPNGNRTYYMGRSQPPFFAEMVNLLAETKEDEAVLQKYLPALHKEYNFWMESAESVTAGEAQERVVKLDTSSVLNRYWSDTATPRAESYREDVLTAQAANLRDENEIYRNICAACESGWDFSSRWFDDPEDLSSIQTTHIIPIDLNVLLYNLEKTLASAEKLSGNSEAERKYLACAEKRKAAMNTYLWNETEGHYHDYNFVTGKPSETLSLAMVFPLFFDLATQEQAEKTNKVLESQFLKPGGLVTTNIENGQQWDSPNGWPPHQWMAIRGLQSYGLNDLANEIKHRWLTLNESVYRRTGKMLEKYNVIDTTLKAGGGEYPTQDGFGWTNGVYLDLKTN
ncbi:MAG: alpha,alpha-trehalase TreF [Leeuwenhoekiella sp.]